MSLLIDLSDLERRTREDHLLFQGISVHVCWYRLTNSDQTQHVDECGDGRVCLGLASSIPSPSAHKFLGPYVHPNPFTQSDQIRHGNPHRGGRVSIDQPRPSHGPRNPNVLGPLHMLTPSDLEIPNLAQSLRSTTPPQLERGGAPPNHRPKFLGPYIRHHGTTYSNHICDRSM